MKTRILSATPITEHRYSELRNLIHSTKQRPPKLAIIQVGNDKASTSYIKAKAKAARSIGAEFDHIHLEADCSAEIFLTSVKMASENPLIDGLLVQLPLPDHLRELNFIDLINPRKDVDGLHPRNIFSLYTGKIESDNPVACTPLGIVNLLKYYNVEIKGKTFCIVGRSLIVGKPLQMLLQAHHATTILCNTQTSNLAELINTSDVLILATGQAQHFDQQLINKKSLVVIDVGINKDSEHKLCGDVHFNNVAPLVKAITPVPGGVGPMTVLSLMENLVKIWRKGLLNE
jgi:methylenetetrahydrofolate dehydrogenase (NADP+)/methenyltetrahydrofolate cyclohydrolase